MQKLMTVNDVLFYIENNFSEGIDIDDITRFSGYSRRHIQGILKKTISMPVGLYIRKRRITESAYLLRLTNMDLIDISLKMGFDSQQTFCREFKKLTGYTPRQYRKNHVWDLSPLTAKVGKKCVTIDSWKLVSLPGNYISGIQYRYNTIIPPTDELYVNRLKIILGQLSSSRQDVWSITEFSPHPYSVSKLKINTIIGRTESPEFNEHNRFHYRSGVYACFSYKFHKDDYHLYSQYIYIKMLPFYNLKREKGRDIEVFYYNPEGFSNDIIACDHYIPVECNGQGF